MSVRLIKIGIFLLFAILSILLYLSLVFVINIIDNHSIIARILFYVFIISYCALTSFLIYKAREYWTNQGTYRSAINNPIAIPWIILIAGHLVSILTLPYYYIKLGYFTWGYVAIAATSLSLILLSISAILIKHTSLFKVKIILRKSVYIYLYICIVIIYLGSCHVYLDYGNDIPLAKVDSLIYFVAIRSSDIYIVVGIILSGYFAFKTYTAKHYNLYLRNFVYDYESRENDCIKLMRKVSRRDVLRIGNPNTLFSLDFNCTTFYLPEIDWQKEVSKLIDKACICFIVLDVSDGVMWEACNHLHNKNKFVYHISDAKKIDQISVKLKNHTDVNSAQDFAKYIDLIKDNIPANNVSCYTFVIRDNAIYCSHDVKSIMRFWQSSKKQILTDDIIVIEHQNTL